MPVFDAHAHADDGAGLQNRRLCGVRTAFSCGNVQEAAAVSALCAEEPLFTMTAGVHPWHAETTNLGDMEPYMLRAALIGEIGMDSVWCSVPLSIQRAKFLQQLDWAQAHGKGIVLHTKGCEREIAEMIRGFSFPVLVHWYSGDEASFMQFLRQGCYFTIGPDVQALTAQHVPDERILFETDGMEAVRWALGRTAADTPLAALESSVKKAAALRGQNACVLAETANSNYLRLFYPRKERAVRAPSSE